MIPKELFEKHKELCDKSLVLMQQKNHDYRSGTNDPFANFRASENLGIDPKLGILIRMSDKLARLATFINAGKLEVKGEVVEDTILDLINYSVLFQAMCEEDKKKTEGKEKVYHTI